MTMLSVSKLALAVSGVLISGAPSVPTESKYTVVEDGQSLGEYKFTRGTPRVTTVFCAELRSALGLTPINSFTLHTSARPYVCTDATSKTGTDYTVRHICNAAGGARLAAASSDAETATGNYFYNLNDNSGVSPFGILDATPNSPGPLWREALTLIETYSPDAWLWSQGQTDVGYIGASQANADKYEDILRQYIAALRTASGKPNLPFIIEHVCRNNVYSESQIQALADIQMRIALDTDNVYIGVEEYLSEFAEGAAINSCTTTNGSNVISTVNTSGTSNNMRIKGTGIPANSFVTAVSPGVSITISKNATASGTVTLYRMDNTHPYPSSIAGLDTDTTLGFYNICKRLVQPMVDIFSGTTTKYFGPYVSAVTAEVDNSYVDLDITHSGGTDITNGYGTISANSKSQFRVENNGSAMTITDVARVDANTLRLTTSVAIAAGTVDVFVAYGAMNKSDYMDFVTDNATLPMPLVRMSPDNFSHLSITVAPAGRQTLAEYGVTSAVAQWDATFSDSYAGSGTSFNNLISSPADGSAQSAYHLTLSNLTFVGTADDEAAYLETAGTGFAELVGSNTTFLNAMHRGLLGADMTLIIPYYVTAATTGYLMSTQNSASSAGVSVDTDTNVTFRQQGDSTSSNVSGGTIATGVWNLLIISHDADGGMSRRWVNSSIGTTQTHVFNESANNATVNFHLFGRNDSSVLMPSGSRFKGAALLNTYCDDTLAATLFAYYNDVHATSYGT